MLFNKRYAYAVSLFFRKLRRNYREIFCIWSGFKSVDASKDVQGDRNFPDELSNGKFKNSSASSCYKV